MRCRERKQPTRGEVAQRHPEIQHTAALQGPLTCARRQCLRGFQRLLQPLLPMHKTSDLLCQPPLSSVRSVAWGLQHHRFVDQRCSKA